MSFKFVAPHTMYASPIYWGPKSIMMDRETFDWKLYQPADGECMSVWFESNPKQLEALLPEGFTLNDPAVLVMVCEFANIGWLAGRTYRLIQVSIPARFDGEVHHYNGDFVLAMFENHTDPIIAGRDGIGYCKTFADIPRYRRYEGVYTATASSWDFNFMKLQLDTNKPAKDAERMKEIAGKSEGKMNYKYVPGTYMDDPPDVAYPIFNPKAWTKPDDYKWELKTPQIEICDGSVEFYKPTWEEMPTYYNLGRGLAELEIKNIIGAQRVLYSEPCDYEHSIKLK